MITGTSESTDVYAADGGKNAGAPIIMDWLARVSEVAHEVAVCFGDSHNDYEMARRFAENGFSTTFVFTGENLKVDDYHADVEVVESAAKYAAGTSEYLTRVLSQRI